VHAPPICLVPKERTDPPTHGRSHGTYRVVGTAPGWGSKEDTAADFRLACAIAGALMDMLQNEPDAVVAIYEALDDRLVAQCKRNASGQWEPA
jgi:hypothetical protein